MLRVVTENRWAMKRQEGNGREDHSTLVLRALSNKSRSPFDIIENASRCCLISPFFQNPYCLAKNADATSANSESMKTNSTMLSLLGSFFFKVFSPTSAQPTKVPLQRRIQLIMQSQPFTDWDQRNFQVLLWLLLQINSCFLSILVPWSLRQKWCLFISANTP